MAKDSEAASLERVAAALEEFSEGSALYKKYKRTDDSDGVNLKREHKIPKITSPSDGLFYIGSKSNVMTKNELFERLRTEMEKNQ